MWSLALRRGPWPTEVFEAMTMKGDSSNEDGSEGNEGRATKSIREHQSRRSSIVPVAAVARALVVSVPATTHEGRGSSRCISM